MSYAEKLRDPRWQKRRLEIFHQDHFACQSCHRKDLELQVHHRKYLKNREPWDYPDELLITLCVGCHAKVTEIKNSVGLLLDNPICGVAFTDLIALLGDNEMEASILICELKKRPKLFKKCFDLAYPYGDIDDSVESECVTLETGYRAPHKD